MDGFVVNAVEILLERIKSVFFTFANNAAVKPVICLNWIECTSADILFLLLFYDAVSFFCKVLIVSRHDTTDGIKKGSSPAIALVNFQLRRFFSSINFTILLNISASIYLSVSYSAGVE